MTRRVSRTILACGALAVALAFSLPKMNVRLSGQATGQPSTAKGDWPYYTADVKGRGTPRSTRSTRATSTSSKSRGASRPTTSARAPNSSSKARRSRSTASSTRPAARADSVVALDGRSGELMWVYSLREGARAVAAPRQLSGRGLSYWTDGKGDDRVLFVTTGYRLVALNAHTGQPDQDLRQGRHRRHESRRGRRQGRADQPRDRRNRPALDAHGCQGRRARRLVVPRRPDGQDAQQHQGPRSRVGRQAAASCSGRSTRFRVRANSATTPGKRSRGRSTATPASGRRLPSTKRPASSICRWKIRRPTSTAVIVPGNNLFGDSLVCVDLKTGQRKWHYQIVHHPIWDYDMPAAPLLDGHQRRTASRSRPSRRPPSRACSTCSIASRGQPVWPIEERPVPQTDVPGEKTARRSRSRPSRRRTRATASRKRI